MERDGLLVCERHQKRELNPRMLPTNSYVCLHRDCRQAFTMLCSACRTDHRDHSTKIMSMEDLSFLMERLLKRPLKQAALFMEETVDIMGKLELMRDFKQKIDLLTRQIEEETLSILEETQGLISNFAMSKKIVHEISDSLSNIEDPKVFAQFRRTTMSKLTNIDYNFKTDQLEYASDDIRELLSKRKLTSASLHSKIEEVKEYNMKIIEVILNQDESDDESDILQKKQQYEELKHRLKSTLLKQKEQKAQDMQEGIPRKEVELAEAQMQTEADKLEERYEQIIKQLKAELKIANSANQKLEGEIKLKQSKIQRELDVSLKEKAELQKQKQKIVKNAEKKNQILSHLDARLELNRKKRIHRQRERQEVVSRLVEILESQREEGVGSPSRSKAKKDRRFSKNTMVSENEYSIHS